jgi:hypothetical protein
LFPGNNAGLLAADRYQRTTTRTVVRESDRRRVVVRRDDYRWRSGRSYAATSVAFVVLGPRVVYRAYGPGWCIGLHRGRHWGASAGIPAATTARSAADCNCVGRCEAIKRARRFLASRGLAAKEDGRKSGHQNGYVP